MVSSQAGRAAATVGLRGGIHLHLIDFCDCCRNMLTLRWPAHTRWLESTSTSNLPGHIRMADPHTRTNRADSRTGTRMADRCTRTNGCAGTSIDDSHTRANRAGCHAGTRMADRRTAPQISFRVRACGAAALNYAAHLRRGTPQRATQTCSGSRPVGGTRGGAPRRDEDELISLTILAVGVVIRNRLKHCIGRHGLQIQARLER